ncbi:MAG: HAMP domain-containing histidine kinase [Clostridia bacterium]|nr:HAMP domain-containing histidine kinase [Clostridia bacterium]
MIYKLRNNFIKICLVSLSVVLALIFAFLVILNHHQVNQTIDALSDAISSNGGVFPDFDRANHPPGKPMDEPDFFTRETKPSTRFFVVRIDNSGNIVGANTEFVSSVNDAEAEEYAVSALEKNNERGWISNFRYKLCDSKMGKSLVFVDGSMYKTLSKSFALTSGFVLLCSGLVVMLLIIVFSKRAVKPVAESYEKQNQFITDANHELKTPLTLILTNLDIAESELGQNEWLDDIRSEGQRMSVLINKLVMLTRMDENNENNNKETFGLSTTIGDVVSEYQPAVIEKRKRLTLDVAENITYSGDESSVRQLMSILMDNALKYCDPEGEIKVSLTAKRHPIICVENTFSDVDNTELDKLFDRFYRSDKARTFGGGYGIGLSIAKMIAEKHQGEIKAYKAAEGRIGFKVILK